MEVEFRRRRFRVSSMNRITNEEIRKMVSEIVRRKRVIAIVIVLFVISFEVYIKY